MELLNLSFAILIVKIALCVLPGVLGVYMIAIGEESKRGMRNAICNKLFGVSNAIALPKFTRFLVIVGSLLLLFSLAASWFLLLSDLVAKG